MEQNITTRKAVNIPLIAAGIGFIIYSLFAFMQMIISFFAYLGIPGIIEYMSIEVLFTLFMTYILPFILYVSMLIFSVFLFIRKIKIAVPVFTGIFALAFGIILIFNLISLANFLINSSNYDYMEHMLGFFLYHIFSSLINLSGCVLVVAAFALMLIYSLVVLIKNKPSILWIFPGIAYALSFIIVIFDNILSIFSGPIIAYISNISGSYTYYNGYNLGTILSIFIAILSSLIMTITIFLLGNGINKEVA